MRVPLSPTALRRLDLVSKLAGLALLAAALEGSLGRWSLPVGLAGLVVGAATIFLDPAESAGE